MPCMSCGLLTGEIEETIPDVVKYPAAKGLGDISSSRREERRARTRARSDAGRGFRVHQRRSRSGGA